MSIVPAAIAIILDETKTKVLLVKRKDIPVWVLPGGGIEIGETPEEAVVREVFEETGLEIKIERKSGEYKPINRLARFSTVFVCRKIGGEEISTSETADIGFFSLDHLPKLIFPLHQEWIQDALQNPTTIVKRDQTSVTYFSLLKTFLRHPSIMLRYFVTRFLR